MIRQHPLVIYSDSEQALKLAEQMMIVRGLHRRTFDPEGRPVCIECDQTWPCRTASVWEEQP